MKYSRLGSSCIDATPSKQGDGSFGMFNKASIE